MTTTEGVYLVQLRVQVGSLEAGVQVAYVAPVLALALVLFHVPVRAVPSLSPLPASKTNYSESA